MLVTFFVTVQVATDWRVGDYRSISPSPFPPFSHSPFPPSSVTHFKQITYYVDDLLIEVPVWH